MKTTAKFSKGQRVEYRNSNYTSQAEIIDIRFHERHQQTQYLLSCDYSQEWHYEEQIISILPPVEKIEKSSVKILYSYWKLTTFLSEIHTQVIEYMGKKYECIDSLRQIYSPDPNNYSPNQKNLIKLI